MSDENTITISLTRYYDLIEASIILACLERGGVDNWEWYSDSISDNFVNLAKNAGLPKEYYEEFEDD